VKGIPGDWGERLDRTGCGGRLKLVGERAATVFKKQPERRKNLIRKEEPGPSKRQDSALMVWGERDVGHRGGCYRPSPNWGEKGSLRRAGRDVQ